MQSAWQKVQRKKPDDDREKVSENTSEEGDIVKFLSRMEYLRPEDSMKCSNYVGETLDMAVELGVKGILFRITYRQICEGVRRYHAHPTQHTLIAGQSRWQRRQFAPGRIWRRHSSCLLPMLTDEALEILQPTGLLKKR